MCDIASQSISVLRGVGPKRVKLYRRLGVSVLGDLIRLYPRTYEDWTKQETIASATPDAPCCIAGSLLHLPQPQRIRSNMTLFRFRVSDGEQVMTVTLFNAEYTAQHLQPGKPYLFFGILRRRGNALEMSAPQIRPADTGGYIRPIYPQTAGLPSRVIEEHMREALALYDAAPQTDLLPAALRKQYGVCTARYALRHIHFPADGEALHIARRRLIFEELFLLQLGMVQMRSVSHTQTAMTLQTDHTAIYEKQLPFSLTGAQRRAIADGIADMRRPYPMSRLIQGDVGSGKTAVAAGLAYSAIRNGMQVALMAPTDILARQHTTSLQKLLGDTCRVELLTGGLPAAEKRRVLTAMADGSALLTVGTHALLSDNVSFARLGLVITDEQHRFGVAQRAALAAKGGHPHLLVMSATPIPRTLALLVYGDLDVSILDEIPPGRQPVATYAVRTDKRQRVYAFIRKHIAAGRQAYIVCPLVEEGEHGGDLVAATAYYTALKNGVFSDIPTALLHGQMTVREKDAVMAAFTAGDIRVLVSTVVIEVGVDVPNAAIMVIENADRFGLSQLHQLRGRVGRGEYPSTCILISDACGAPAVERLKIMCGTTDGFKIAEADLHMRGPGDFFGSRQHGLPKMRIANLITDMAVLREARSAADALHAADPRLSHPEHRALADAVNDLFAKIGDPAAN